jgi:small-conductance mechanosensitive channel
MKKTLELLILMSSTICALSIAVFICLPFFDFDFETMKVFVMAFLGGLIGLVVSFQLSALISFLPDNFDSKKKS